MLTGSMVALVTPMETSGTVDWPAFERLIEFQIEAGTDALVINGTTAETATLSLEERRSALKQAIQIVAGRIPVIAGAGSNSTQATIESALEAKALGAAATLLVCPYYNRPTQEGLYLHFKAVAEAVAIPHILYNVPSRTVVDMSDDITLRLSKISNIQGIKDATGDISRARELLKQLPADFAVLSGDDPTAVELIAEGGHGFISVTANVAPKAMKVLCDTARAGKLDEARQQNQTLMPLHQALFLEPNPIPVKWALARMGLMEGGIRLPLTPLSAQYHQTLNQALVDSGMLP